MAVDPNLVIAAGKLSYGLGSAYEGSKMQSKIKDFSIGKWNVGKGLNVGMYGAMGTLGTLGAIKKRKQLKEENRLLKEQEQQNLDTYNDQFDIFNKGQLATYPMQGTSGIDRFMFGGELDTNPLGKYKKNKYGQYVDDKGQVIGYEKLDDSGNRVFVNLAGDNPSFNVFNKKEEIPIPKKEVITNTSSGYETILPNMQKVKQAPAFDSKTRKVSNRKFYKNGGDLSLQLEGGEMYQLSDDIAEFEGNTHEEGGIMLDQTNEVEDGETIKDGTKIYSDTLTVNPNTIKMLSDSLGFKPSGNTYAEISKSLAKKKDFYENNYSSRFSDKTNELMLDRINQATEMLFQDQEVNKPVEETSIFRDGGRRKNLNNYGYNNSFMNTRNHNIRRMNDHDYKTALQFAQINNRAVPETLIESIKNSQLELIKNENINSFNENINNINKNKKFSKEQLWFGRTQPDIKLRTKLEKKSFNDENLLFNTLTDNKLYPNVNLDKIKQSDNKIYNFPTDSIELNQSVTDQPLFNVNTDNINQGFDFSKVDFTNNNKDIIDPNIVNPEVATKNKFNLNTGNIDLMPLITQGANYLNYRRNKNMVKNLPDKIDPTFVNAPRFNYIDRSGADRADIDTSTSSAIKQLQRSSGQDVNAGNLSAIMSANIQGKNRVSQIEGQREDQARQQFDNNMINVNAQNAGISNQFNQINTQLNIDKIRTLNDVNNAFTQGVIANLQVAEANKMEGAKALLTAVKDGNTDVVTRLLQQYPHLAKILKLQNFNG